MTKATLIALLLSASGSQAQSNALDYPSVWRCDEPKFNWYCDQEREPKPSESAAARTPPTTIKRIEITDIKVRVHGVRWCQPSFDQPKATGNIKFAGRVLR